MPFEDEEDFRVPEDARFEKIFFDRKKPFRNFRP